MNTRIADGVAALLWLSSSTMGSSQSQIAYEVRQLTSGPAHHFYGYRKDGMRQMFEVRVIEERK